MSSRTREIRYEYIRWIKNLLDTSSDEYTATYDEDRTVIGIDIGVGASCIYPLLGSASRPKWRFGGTDIDSKNLEFAAQNIKLNGLQNRIRLKQVDPSGPIIALDTLGIKQADFVMCNPPFYRSKEDMAEAAANKDKPPSAVCTGAEVEMICEDGDLGFVLRMVEEGRRLKDSVQWYSSMLGKLSSVTAIVAKLKEIGVNNWALTALQAGKVTKRWAVAWSYGDMRPRNDVARGNLTNKEILPFPTDFTIRNLQPDKGAIRSSLGQILQPLDMECKREESNNAVLCLAKGDVWSRAARRKKAKEATQAEEIEEDEDPALVVRVTMLHANGESGKAQDILAGVMPTDAPRTLEASAPFSPPDFATKWLAGDLGPPSDNPADDQHNFENSIRRAFSLKHNDTYVYHAVMSVRLAQVQSAVDAAVSGEAPGLRRWYFEGGGGGAGEGGKGAQPIEPPPQPDISAYTSIFNPQTDTSKSLKAFASNAKKNSIRSRVAKNLTSKRHYPSTDTTGTPVPPIPRAKTLPAHIACNPYLSFWAWTCQHLQWCGPDSSTSSVKHSHPLLPILYHHFGCVCPTHEALSIIKHVADGGKRPVIDLGSGNGYWTWMLRRYGVQDVWAVDNGDSVWRTMWVGDTVQMDGGKFLREFGRGGQQGSSRSKNTKGGSNEKPGVKGEEDTSGAKSAVLLLVYPQVTTQFTVSALEEYKGDTICVAGTQNENRFTGFREESFEEWMRRERPGFEKVVQTPLPSFAGKDEALFVWRRYG
ncbi:MAG: hypothetical protein M1831_000340 [Alyxoria varia]|nr:MAG: hypothetical protein M1831_000340 [Alyxoria varia]